MEYKPVPGLRNRTVSRCGKIKGEGGRDLIPRHDHDGYLATQSHMLDGSGRKWTSVHRMVAKAWIPNPEGLEQVNHINRLRDDNRVENLEWVTARQNSIHGQGGTLCHFAKLSKEDVANIRAEYVLGKKMTHIAKEHGVHPDTISEVVHWRTFDYPCP